MKCHKCGSGYFEESVRVGGWVKQQIDENGEIFETSLDSMRKGARSKTVICSDCGCRCKNPAMEGSDD